MSETLRSLGIDQLSIAPRILLVEEIWDSIAAEAEEVPLTEAHREALERRVAAYLENPDAVASWDEVKAGFRSQS
jgi:putative addiction module component (TIGR02574 family)